MIEAVRHNRQTLIDRFGCSRRLATRLGALMGKHITISALLLEELPGNPALEALILKKSLLDQDDLPRVIQELQTTDDFSSLAEELPLVVVEQDGWRILSAVEETLADEGWSESSESTSESSSLPEFQSLQLSRTHTPAHAALPSSVTGTPFTADESARLRVNVFAAATSAEKVAALRQIAFAGLEENEKIRIFLQAAANEDRQLRGAAAGALRAIGLSPDIADTAALAATGGSQERMAAVDRLRDLTDDADAFGRNAILMSLLGGLRDHDTEDILLHQILNALADSVPAFGKERLGNDDILRILLELTLAADDTRLATVRRCLHAVEAECPGWVADAILKELNRTRSIDYRATLIELLSGLTLAPRQLNSIVDVCAETLLAAPTDSDASFTAGRLLKDAGDVGLVALARRLPAADHAHQRHLIRFFDNALLGNSYETETRETIAQNVLEVMRSAPKQVRADAIETRVLARKDIDPDIRETAASVFLNDLRNYARWPLCETMENALVSFGRPAVGPLVTALVEHKSNSDAIILAGALGRIGRDLAHSENQDDLAAAESILRQMQRLTFGDTACRDALHLALGRICSGPGISHEIGNLVMRTLLSRLEGTPADAVTLQGLGLLCHGRGPSEEEIRTIARLALQHLETTQPDPSVNTDSVDGEDLFVFGDEVDVYADLIPACLEVLENVSLARRCPSDLSAELVTDLLQFWDKASRFEIQWSPANVAQLTVALGRIATSEATSGTHRIRIANTLARRAGELSVLESLASILKRGDPVPQLDRLGGAILLRLLERLDTSENLRLEDQEIYLRLLATVASRGRFEVRGGGVDRLLERSIDAITAGLRLGVPGCFQHLVNLRDAETLPEKHVHRLHDELQRFTQLSTTQ